MSVPIEHSEEEKGQHTEWKEEAVHHIGPTERRVRVMTTIVRTALAIEQPLKNISAFKCRSLFCFICELDATGGREGIWGDYDSEASVS